MFDLQGHLTAPKSHRASLRLGKKEQGLGLAVLSSCCVSELRTAVSLHRSQDVSALAGCLGGSIGEISEPWSSPPKVLIGSSSDLVGGARPEP